MEEPNVLYKTGTCCQCGHLTDIEKQGCNYMLYGESKSIDDLKEAIAIAEEAGCEAV